MESLKECYILVYREAWQLRNFGILNYTAGIKILKKYKKIGKDDQDTSETKSDRERVKKQAAKWSTRLDEATFHTQGSLSELLESIEKSFALSFCDGNTAMAKGMLLMKMDSAIDWDLLMLGIRLGIIIMLAIWNIWDCSLDAYMEYGGSYPSMWHVYEYPVYRGIGCSILVVWCWGFMLMVWRGGRVNYLYLLEIDPRHAPEIMGVWRMASTLSIVFLINLAFFNKMRRHEIPHMASFPRGLLPGALVVYCFWRISFALYNSPPFGQVLLDTIRSPMVKVTFYASFVGDWMTSLVKVFVDLWFVLVYICSGRFLVMHQLDPDNHHLHVSTEGCNGPFFEISADHTLCEETEFYNAVNVYIRPALIMFPFWLRMMQNLRKYKDENTKTQRFFFWNAMKYGLAMCITLFGSFSPDLYEMQGSRIGFKIVFVIALGASTCYTYYWDVYNDWGLGKTGHAFLRADLLYRRRWCYYATIAADLFLRFTWTLTLLPSRNNPYFANILLALSPWLAAWEICRRTMWGCFRLENEHLHNSEGYRRVTFIPLYFDAPEEEGETTNKRSSNWRSLIEIVTFVLIVVALGVIAIVTKDSRG